MRGARTTGSYRITSGTRMLSSYGTSFLTQRCSPHEIPLSEVKTIRVFDRRPVSANARSSLPTDRSTESSEAYWSRRNASSAATSAPVNRGSDRMYEGLSETSASS